MADSVGMADLRAENVDRVIKGLALQEYRFKDLCLINTSSAWIETYYKETAADITGGTGAAIKGVPRLAQFPYGETSWTKASSYIEKYAIEGVISMEDVMQNNVDVLQRTLIRIARAVTKAVDAQIYSVLSAGAGNSVAITAGYEWDSATIANRDPIQDILNAKKTISIDNFDPDNGNTYLLLSPTDYANLLGNSKVINNPTFKAADVVANGVVGQICGLKIIVSNNVTADEALVVIAKDACTWKQAKPLTTETIIDPGIKYTIRAYEMGVAQLIAADAVCKISNTQK